MCFNYQDTEWRQIALIVSNISFNFIRYSSGIAFVSGYIHTFGTYIHVLVGAPTAEHARH